MLRKPRFSLFCVVLTALEEAVVELTLFSMHIVSSSRSWRKGVQSGSSKSIVAWWVGSGSWAGVLLVGLGAQLGWSLVEEIFQSCWLLCGCWWCILFFVAWFAEYSGGWVVREDGDSGVFGLQEFAKEIQKVFFFCWFWRDMSSFVRAIFGAWSGCLEDVANHVFLLRWFNEGRVCQFSCGSFGDHCVHDWVDLGGWDECRDGRFQMGSEKSFIGCVL